MSKLFLIVIMTLSTVGCQSAGPPCIQEINLLPMYGRVKKCPEQLEADQQFLAECKHAFRNNQEASLSHSKRGWNAFYAKQYDDAMKRFNQAWLLDSLNAEVYWGFGNTLGANHQFKESLPLLEKAISLDPRNSSIWESAATSYGQLFFITKDVDLLNKDIDYLKKAVSLDNTNAKAYGQLAAAYSYFTQKDSAKKYLVLTDRLDRKAVHPEVRKMLERN